MRISPKERWLLLLHHLIFWSYISQAAATPTQPSKSITPFWADISPHASSGRKAALSFPATLRIQTSAQSPQKRQKKPYHELSTLLCARFHEVGASLLVSSLFRALKGNVRTSIGSGSTLCYHLPAPLAAAFLSESCHILPLNPVRLPTKERLLSFFFPKGRATLCSAVKATLLSCLFPFSPLPPHRCWARLLLSDPVVHFWDNSHG